jgi:hypothetical protein
MTPLSLADLPSLDAFEAERDAMRAAVIAHKADRRIALGDRLTLLFEDRETIRWQVLEMCRVEGIRDPAGVAEELEVYNELVPGAGELSATLFIEITEAPKIRPELDRLVGIHECVALEIGETHVPARFDPRQLDEDRISAVHYLRFAPTPADGKRFADPAVPVSLRVDHPHYRAETVPTPATRASLSVDLRGDPEPIFRFSSGAAATPKLLRERGTLRALELGPDHVVIEAEPPAPPWLELPDPRALEFLGLAREIAAEWQQAGRRPALLLDVTAPAARIEVRVR